MSIWYYYNESGEKIRVESSAELKRLALSGVISSDTIIENETGKSCKADKVKGLVLSESVKIEPPNNDFYGVALPVPMEPQPVIVPVPPVVPTTVTKTKNKGRNKIIPFIVVVGLIVLLIISVLIVYAVQSKIAENKKIELARAKAIEQQKQERLEKEERERIEKERIEREEQERVEREERECAEKEEKERVEKEKIEKEKQKKLEEEKEPEYTLEEGYKITIKNWEKIKKQIVRLSENIEVNDRHDSLLLSYFLLSFQLAKVETMEAFGNKEIENVQDFNLVFGNSFDRYVEKKENEYIEWKNSLPETEKMKAMKALLKWKTFYSEFSRIHLHYDAEYLFDQPPNFDFYKLLCDTLKEKIKKREEQLETERRKLEEKSKEQRPKLEEKKMTEKERFEAAKRALEERIRLEEKARRGN
jgi:competence protein ComGC